jgi:exodeoxyribonuclease VII small subunit
MSQGDDRIAYGDAVAQLERILAELESDDVDVDRLGERVRVAVELIRVCRERITETEMEVTRIVADLDTESGTDQA